MPKVFVVGALLPAGGAYMAYHLGRLLHVHFGYELLDVNVKPVERKMFQYDILPRTVTVAQLESAIGPDDLLIVNPSFSYFLFGLRLPGRKICYAQDFKTFAYLDCHCDLYIAVSSVVQRFLRAVYDISVPVIPPFIQLNRMPKALPWQERLPGSVLVYMKNPSHEHRLLLEQLTQTLKEKMLPIDLSNLLEGRGLSHEEFMQRIGSVRYFINLSLAEGFGLVPLEAMAMGAMVTGVDGLGGRDYMRQGENCLVSSVTDLRTLLERVCLAFSDEALARRCAAEGQATARLYGYAPFKAAWLAQLSAFLQKEPANA